MLNLTPLPPRIIPCLLLQDDVFVKTKNFKNPVYIGDPINTINLFNKFEVDEIIVLDIGCSRKNCAPNFSLIEDLANECWVPLTYGGGIRSMADAKRILNSGIEKVVIDSLLHSEPEAVKHCVNEFGSSSVVACINTKKTLFGKYTAVTFAGNKKVEYSLNDRLQYIHEIGIGELVINNISRDGTRQGFDLELTKQVSTQLNIPVITLGGASNIADFKLAVDSGASAVAAGSLFVFQNNDTASILINYPSRKDLETLFYV